MHTQFNTSSVQGGNTGSSANLTSYLDKEQQNEWFSATENGVKTKDVTADIDQNGKGQLGKDDWKFIEVEYNPSQKEQQVIIEQATGRTDVTEWNQLTKDEQQKVKGEFTEYVRDAQHIQAKNYNRENINSGADLKYYGKIETQRKYKGTDERVKRGEVKQGQLKEGLNMHVHIVQSRKAIDKKTKLSPTSKHRGASNKNKIQQGFNRNEFYNKLEQRFDEKYSHNRDVKESFEWQKANKLNRLEDKKELESKAKTGEKKSEREELLQKMKDRPIERKPPKRQEITQAERIRIKRHEKQQERRNNRGMSR